MDIDVSYMMLPLDETPFAINADTRAITTPKLVVLQYDQLAETIMFTVDRYFDYMDLNNANIHIQWTLKSGKTDSAEVEMKDLSIPGKIRFGWTLDERVTSEVGPVKFSVRFWKKGLFVDDNGQEVEKVVYSFNTLTATLNVTESLQKDISTTPSTPVRDNLFKRAIRNSQIIGENIVLPIDPIFSEPGKDLHSTASLNPETNTLVLEAQASVGDTGHIDYEWYYKPAVNMEEEGFNKETFYPFNEVTLTNADGTTSTIKGFSKLGGIVEEDYRKVDYSKGLVLGEQYYVASSESSTGYAAYTSATAPTDGTELFERFTTYTVPAGDVKVTGEYQVRATNFIYPNTSKEVYSAICQLISPDDVVISSDLPNRLVIEDKAVGIKAEVKANKQTSSDTSVTYDWQKSVESDTMTNSAKVNATAAYTAKEPGWYQVTVNALLNREDKEASTRVCKVTFMPELPTVEYNAEALLNMDENFEAPVYSTTSATFGLDVGSVIPEGYETYNEKLFSEELIYTWFMLSPDKTSRALVPEDIGVIVEGELGKPTLTVKNLDTDPMTAYGFYCLITNNLNGKSITTALEDALYFYVQ